MGGGVTAEVPAGSAPTEQVESDVGDHVLLAADHPAAADLDEEGTGVDAVLLGGGFGVAQETRVDARVAEGQGFPVDAHVPVLDLDEADRLRLAERVVTAQDDPVGPDAADERPEHLGVIDTGVEIQVAQVLARYAGGVGNVVDVAVKAAAVVGQVAAAMGDDDLQGRQVVEPALVDDRRQGACLLDGPADGVPQRLVEVPGSVTPCGCRKTTGPRSAMASHTGHSDGWPTNYAGCWYRVAGNRRAPPFIRALSASSRAFSPAS